MRAAWFQFRVALRARWLAWTSIAMLAGLAAGVVMGAVAGARRTDSSLQRVVVENRASDLFVGFNNGLMSPAQRERFVTLPQVADYAYQQGVAMVMFENGEPDLDVVTDSVVLTNPDGHAFDTIDRAGVVAGRIPDADQADALVVNEAAARRMHLRAGQRIRVGFADVDDLDDFDGTAASLPKLTEMPLTVAAVIRTLDDATRAADDPRQSPRFMLTRALSRRVAPLGGFYDGLSVRLHDPGQVGAYESAVREAAGSNVLSVQELGGTLERARRAIRPYVLALWFFAILALLAGAAVVGQVMTRQRRVESGSLAVLRALGMTRGELRQAALLRGLFIGVVAAVVAMLVAIAGSPLMPIGPLRILEPRRGVDADLTVLIVGALLVVLFVIAYGAVGAVARRSSARVHRNRVSGAIAGSGAPAPVSTGVRLALDPGRGDAAIPVWSTAFGVGLAIAALVATLVYASSLAYFTSTPKMYGWVWSYQLESGGDLMVPELIAGAARLTQDPRVDGAAVGAYCQLEIAGHTLGSIAVQPNRGVAVAEIVAGREPRRADEIALGVTTLRDVHRGVGDTVEVGVGKVRNQFRIVGRAVFPRFAPYPSSEPTGLGIGAAMTLDGLRRFGPLDNSPNAPLAGSPFVLVNAKPGADASQLRQIGFGDDPAAADVYGPQRPNDVSSYQHLERTPLALAGLLVLLAIATMVHLLVSAVRRRRRELGLLRALGFTTAQLRVSVLVQATTLITLALIVAIPVGVIAGRLLWDVTARWLGIPIHQVVPFGEIALVAAGALVVGNLAALVPAVSAGRVQPAEILRSE